MPRQLDHLRPSLRLNPEELGAFLYECGLFPSMSRFDAGCL